MLNFQGSNPGQDAQMSRVEIVEKFPSAVDVQVLSFNALPRDSRPRHGASSTVQANCYARIPYPSASAAMIGRK